VGVVLLLAQALAAVEARQWETGVIPESIGGSFSSLQIDKYGNGHVIYAEENENLMQYSFWDHDLRKWFTTTLDRGYGFCSLVLDSRQRPHISYPQYGQLRYALWDGASWQKQTIPIAAKNISFFTSIALDKQDNPSITFYEVAAGSGEQLLRLRMVTWNRDHWELRTVDSEPGSGKFNSLAIDSAGRPHVAYGNVEYKSSSLRYAHWTGSGWDNEILEGAGVPGTYRQAVNLILDKNDVPHMAYHNIRDRIVMYATQINGKWQMQAVDSIGAAAYPDRNGIALDDNGTPYISYYDAKIGVLKLAYRRGNKWFSEIVDSGFAGYTSSLQIHNGIIWLTYSHGPAGGLKYAYRAVDMQVSATKPLSSGVLK
jgi:hypothetical protein